MKYSSAALFCLVPVTWVLHVQAQDLPSSTSAEFHPSRQNKSNLRRRTTTIAEAIHTQHHNDGGGSTPSVQDYEDKTHDESIQTDPTERTYSATEILDAIVAQEFGSSPYEDRSGAEAFVEREFDDESGAEAFVTREPVVEAFFDDESGADAYVTREPAVEAFDTLDDESGVEAFAERESGAEASAERESGAEASAERESGAEATVERESGVEATVERESGAEATVEREVDDETGASASVSKETQAESPQYSEEPYTWTVVTRDDDAWDGESGTEITSPTVSPGNTELPTPILAEPEDSLETETSDTDSSDFPSEVPTVSPTDTPTSPTSSPSTSSAPSESPTSAAPTTASPTLWPTTGTPSSSPSTGKPTTASPTSSPSHTPSLSPTKKILGLDPMVDTNQHDFSREHPKFVEIDRQVEALWEKIDELSSKLEEQAILIQVLEGIPAKQQVASVQKDVNVETGEVEEQFSVGTVNPILQESSSDTGVRAIMIPFDRTQPAEEEVDVSEPAAAETHHSLFSSFSRTSQGGSVSSSSSGSGGGSSSSSTGGVRVAPSRLTRSYFWN